MSSTSESGRDALWDEDSPNGAGQCASVDAGTSTVVTAEVAVAEHIGYLLNEIPLWLDRGWIDEDGCEVLTEVYSSRRELLLHPGAPVGRSSEGDGSGRGLVSAGRGEEAGSGAEAARGPGLAGFLEAHSMKLVALIAGLLILAGMRQFVAWKWGSGLVFSLMPLLPICLTGIFYFFGIRDRTEKDLGGYAYCAVAIILSAFSVFSVNEHWLGSALSGPYALTVSFAVASLLTACTLRITRDQAYLHLLFAGIAATLNAALQARFSSSWLAPSPLWAYGAMQVGLALMVLIVARRLHPPGEDRRAVERAAGPVLVWMHLLVAIGFCRAVLLFVDGRGDDWQAGLLMALFAGLSALYAHWFGRVVFAYTTAGAGIAAASLILVGAGRAEWYLAGAASLILCGLALRISSIEPLPSDAEAELRGSAYRRIGWGMAAAAGVFLAGRAVSALLGSAPSPAASDWSLGALVAAVSAVLYAGLSLRSRKVAVLYPASAATAFALAVATDRSLHAAGLAAPLGLAQDLVPFAVLYTALVLWLDREKRSLIPQDWKGALPALSLSTCVAIAAGLAMVAAQWVWSGSSAMLWTALAVYGIVTVVGTSAHRMSASRVLSTFWPLLLIADTGLFIGFTAVKHLPASIWTAALAVAFALVALSWFWFGIAEGVRSKWVPLSDALRLGAGLLAATAATFATSAVEGAVGWMGVIYSAALGLMVAMGARAKSEVPVFASFIVVLLCPLRLSGAALSLNGTGTPGVLTAVAFALFAATVYGIATWRMRKPSLVWLSAAALAIAGGGGILFGAPRPELSRWIALTSGWGMTLGAFGLVVTAGWGRLRMHTYAAGAMGLVGYVRLVTIPFAVERPWMGMAMLPAILLLVAASHLRAQSHGEVFRQPLQRVALAASYIILPLLGWSALWIGPSAYYPLTVTLFSYALIFGISAQAGKALDHPLGILSTGALVAGWFFGLQVPHSYAFVRVSDTLLVTVTAVCAGLYGSLAWRLEKQAPAYGAALAAICAWVGMMGRLTGVPEPYWSVSSLVLLVALYAVGEGQTGERGEALSIPFRRAAWAGALISLLWAVYTGVQEWTPGTGLIAAVSFLLYGFAFAVGAQRYRTWQWSSASAIMFTMAYGFALATVSPRAPMWSSLFVPAGLILLASARVLGRNEDTHDLAKLLPSIASATALVAALVALVFSLEPTNAWPCVWTFVVAGAVEIAAFASTRLPEHLHAAFFVLLPAYFILLNHAARLDTSFADLYVLPIGLYLLVVGHLAVRSGDTFIAWVIRWAGMFAAMAPALGGFATSLTRGGSPAHALLLLTESTAAIAYGIAGRVRALVQGGTAFALAFVAVATFSAAEIWTGFFSIMLGTALLVAVFYLSVHREAVGKWVNRSGTGIRPSR